MRLRGPLGQQGLLTLTDQRLHFGPTSVVDRMMGAETVFISLSDISAVGARGLGSSVLHVTAGGVKYRFKSRALRFMPERIQTLRGMDSQSS